MYEARKCFLVGKKKERNNFLGLFYDAAELLFLGGRLCLYYHRN